MAEQRILSGPPTITMAAVLPLKAESKKTDSFSQVNLLFQSLQHFSEESLFEIFYVIVPEKSLQVTRELCSAYADDFNFECIAEEEIVSGLKPWISGWRKQQLIKLAMSEWISQPFYMTFDADVILTKSITKNTLFPAGKPLLQYIKKSGRPDWWISSGEILEVDPLLDELGMGTTPAILRTDMVKELLAHLSARDKDGNWMRYLTKSYPLPLFEIFKKPIKWTEYSLYHLFLRHHKKVQDLHHICYPDDSLKVVTKHSVWNNVNFHEWNPDWVFDESDPGVFCIIQSNKNISVDTIAQKIQPYLRP